MVARQTPSPDRKARHLDSATLLFLKGSTILTLPAWLDLSAVAVGALSGAMVGTSRKLDLVGTVALAFLCGLGGGLIRDMIMQKGDVYMLNSTNAVIVSVLTGVVVFLFPTLFERIPNALEWVDIVSVALFVVAGTNKAVVYELGAVQTILMGVITGVGGGMLRDVFLGDVPKIFQPSNFYAVCALGGSVVYLALMVLCNVGNPWCAFVSVFVTVALRRASLRYDIMSPGGVDLTPRVTEPVKRAVANHTQKKAEKDR